MKSQIIANLRGVLDIIFVQLRTIYKTPEYKDESPLIKTCLRSIDVAVNYALSLLNNISTDEEWRTEEMKKKVIKSKDLTNEQKYKTVTERDHAFNEFCMSIECSHHLSDGTPCSSSTCRYHWLTLKYEEQKPDTPFEVKGNSIVNTETSKPIITKYFGGMKQLCHDLNVAVFEWHRRMKKNGELKK